MLLLLMMHVRMKKERTSLGKVSMVMCKSAFSKCLKTTPSLLVSLPEKKASKSYRSNNLNKTAKFKLASSADAKLPPFHLYLVLSL